jgi:transposase-like protein
MIPCKNCHQNNPVQNGDVRNQQRYKCHSCRDNFVEGDARHTRATA